MQQADYDVELDSVISGFDGETFWAHARTGRIPRNGDQPPLALVVTTPCTRTGSDFFGTLHSFLSLDGGKTWSGPVAHEDSFGARDEPGGWTVRMCDPMPQYHDPTGKLLVTGHTVRYLDEPFPPSDRARETAWSVYDETDNTFSPWESLSIPDEPRLEASGAGSTQRVDLEDGTILLPTYGRPRSEKSCYATVMRCSFDGHTLQYREHGNLLSLPDPRGCCEPSICRFQDRFYLTIRNDVRGYVATSDDGLNFSDPVPWTFDDGSELGNYNTQQHWIPHDDSLYLVYTRRGLDNDNVFRHRAPLMVGRVDPERLCVWRETERELVPNRGARLGNFGVTDFSREEAWVTVSEFMHKRGEPEQYGSDNTIWIARLQWKQTHAS